MNSSIVYTSSGIIDRCDKDEVRVEGVAHIIQYADAYLYFSIVDYVLKNKDALEGVTSLFSHGDMFNSFIVNKDGYRKYIILGDSICFAKKEESGDVVIGTMKKCSDEILRLMDITDLTHAEILDNMEKLTKYMMSFTDYINSFDDCYVFCNTKSSSN